jgi:CRP-like cAMP-binding protein
MTWNFRSFASDTVRTHTVVPMDDQMRPAIASSHFRELPASALTTLLERARRRLVPAGGTLHHAGDSERHVELVVRGLVRVHARAPDGRTLTVRYCRTGAIMGVMSLYADERPMLVQALQPERL